MKQKTIIKYIKDHWIYALIYLVFMMCIIVFYHVSTDGKAEIIYPLMIGFYGFAVLTAISSYRYFGFRRRIGRSIHNPHYDLLPRTEEQRAINDAIQAIHQRYIRELQTMRADNEAWRHFLSQWVHNLKTPISVINLITQKTIAQATGTGEAMYSIAEENEKLASGVDQLLSLIRLENFPKDYVPERMDLAEELPLIITGMKKHFVMHHVFPVLQIKSVDTLVFSDRKWHKLMLEQFLSNAVKYSRREENLIGDTSDSKYAKKTDSDGDQDTSATVMIKRVYIILEQEEQGLRLTIRDEGIGIPDYDLPRIFEPFFTGDNGRENRNATGIGLYIADAVARKLNHRIEVKSTEGVGTTVTIYYSAK